MLTNDAALMTEDELKVIEENHPGLFTTPNIGVNYEVMPPNDEWPRLSNLVFCCEFPVPFKWNSVKTHLVATCPGCGASRTKQSPDSW